MSYKTIVADPPRRGSSCSPGRRGLAGTAGVTTLLSTAAC